MKTCPDCAESVQSGANVCRFCGYRFSAEPSVSPEPARQEGGPGRLRAVVIVLCLLGVGAAAINTTYGAIFLGGLLALLVIISVAQWVAGAGDRG